MSDTPSRIETLSKVAAGGAQIAAVLGVASLVAAILSNWIFFAFVDLTLLSAYTVSDHIATAIDQLPYILGLSAYMLWHGGRQGAQSAREGIGLMALLVVFGLVNYAFTSYLGWEQHAGISIGLAVGLGWVWGGDKWLKDKLSSWSPESRLASRFAAVVLALIVSLSLIAGMSIGLSSPRHRVILPANTIEGVVHQILERGVIVYVLPVKVWMFIPKDQIKRIENIAR